jgi:hypothetical protein
LVIDSLVGSKTRALSHSDIGNRPVEGKPVEKRVVSQLRQLMSVVAGE